MANIYVCIVAYITQDLIRNGFFKITKPWFLFYILSYL